uniref:Uncharacterized protein n=1 Tax=Oryza meridionalis TaxID=40149 RepID=A0A0E0FBW4_9ORYZ
MERLTGERRGAGSDGGFSRADGGCGGSRDGERGSVDAAARPGSRRERKGKRGEECLTVSLPAWGKTTANGDGGRRKDDGDGRTGSGRT